MQASIETLAPQKFRKLPVEIEAMRYDPRDDDSVDTLMIWVNNSASECSAFLSKRGLEISTLEGVMRADPGDWIIRGVSGEFYPCKPDIFAGTYELA